MKATIQIRIESDDGETLYDGEKASFFQLEGFYDRMLLIQLTELVKSVKSDIKESNWFKLLKDERISDD